MHLCGHATLASAHILWETKIADKKESIHFHTLSGELIAKKKNTGIELDFPKGSLKKSDGDDYLFKALNIRPINIYEDDIVYVLEFDNEEEINSLEPDFNLLKKANKKEVIVTSKSKGDNCDFVSRFFGPSIGVDEDPVTGSAHCYLAPYWIEKLQKEEVLGFQASKKTGFIRCRLEGDRVILQGQAVTILEGALRI